MKKIYFIITVFAAFILFAGVKFQNNFSTVEDGKSGSMRYGEAAAAEPVTENRKILIAYFSHTGSTREIAQQIQSIAGGDIFEIKGVKTYPDDYEELKKIAKQELNSLSKPALKSNVNNLKSYDIVFIGYPIWWGTFPAPVRTFLSENDLSGKTIVPFSTHLGSGLGLSVRDVKKLCPDSTLLDGAAIWGRDVKTSQNKVTEWLRKIKIIK